MNCPRCGGPVEEGAATCLACGLELEWSEELAEAEPGQSLVCVQRVTEIALLPVLASLLEAEGIPMALHNDAGSVLPGVADGPFAWSPGSGAVRVMVPAPFEEAARELIATQVPMTLSPGDEFPGDPAPA